MRETRSGTTPPTAMATEDNVIAHVSLPEAVHAALRRRIINNEFAAGERLVESRISEEFGVSRTTLRAALRELARENLVEISNRHGCFVARMSSAEIEDSLYARYLLEASAASNDLHWITPELLVSLEDQIENMKTASATGDMASVVDADTVFHGIILSAGGRARVAELWHMLDGQMGSLMRSSLDEQDNEVDIAQRHELVIEALRSGHADTIERAIRDHYIRSALQHDH